MFEEYLIVLKFLGALLAGYLLGSVPFAQLGARFRGIDIFGVGSRTAGAANVFWNVDRGTGLVVMAADVAKGAAAVLVAGMLGLAWPLALLVGGAAVLGHWKSIFSGFRGGDGMAALVGVALTLQPVLAILGLLIGTGALLLSRRSQLRGAWALSTCVVVMLMVSQYYQIDRGMVLGLVALAILVLLHTMVSWQHRGSTLDDEELLGLEPEADQEGDLGPPTPESR